MRDQHAYQQSATGNEHLGNFMQAANCYAISSRHLISAFASVLAAGLIVGQAALCAPGDGSSPPTLTAEQDHQNMMDQLGIQELRPAPNGHEDAPDHANYDEALANPYPNLPDPLTTIDGRKVKTAAMWWKTRRPEIVEDLEREVYGRVPLNVPGVIWSVAAVDNSDVGGLPVVVKHLLGHVDDSADPAIIVEIAVTLVLPADAKKPVPVLMMLDRNAFPTAAQFTQRNADGDPPSVQELIADGWGFALVNPVSIQADNGAGLRQGIIGLVNNGGPRKPDDWGALRAWAWGAGRVLDYLQSDPAVDSRHVGIEGVSRYGKAALVTMAFDQRFFMAFIASSGKGGATLLRRNWGEGVENLARGEYYWMAGNFMKYSASKAAFGMGNPGQLPVDSHDLIALCAPRLAFVSYGIPESGDVKWTDQKGGFMAAVAAQPVYKLLGARGMGVRGDYRTAQLPPANDGLLGGRLAWRMHDGGHTEAPNTKYFLRWADKFIRHSAPSATAVH
jgi:hypothetical protein